jgi:predicted nucleic acid-binding protein
LPRQIDATDRQIDRLVYELYGLREKGDSDCGGRNGEVKIYLNVSCLNRPFDDQEQARIRLEASAVGMILERVDEGRWTHVSSEMARMEIDANPDPARRARARLLLPESRNIVMLTPATFARARALQSLGFKPADAVHVAAAEEAGANVLLSCDDRFCRTGRRRAKELRVRIENPLAWLDHEADTR